MKRYVFHNSIYLHREFIISNSSKFTSLLSFAATPIREFLNDNFCPFIKLSSPADKDLSPAFLVITFFILTIDPDVSIASP